MDVVLFRFINQTLANPVFDQVMPVLAGGAWFIPLVLVAAVLWMWKGGRRARVAVVMLAVLVPLGDGLVCNPLKKSIGRPRPFDAVPEARVLVGKGSNRSMPSGHAMNWFAAAAILFLYSRRSVRFMGPAAVAVAFSRVYNGVHYPSDVVVGAGLGVAWGWFGVWGLEAIWRKGIRPLFPGWLRGLPSLREPERMPEVGSAAGELKVSEEAQWLRLGYVLVALGLVFRLGYLASGKVELSEDEAYQWIWSKHLALSYYSKPPMIALAQWVGTHLWGDTAFGVRFLSPISGALLSLLLLRFLAREGRARLGALLVAVCLTTPLLIVGSLLMTVDVPLVLFWMLAVLAGWRAVQPGSGTRDWVWVGLWVGLAFLSKYTGMYYWVCLGLFTVIWKPMRAQWRRPGPWVAIGIALLCTVPVVVWNLQHGWITVTHLSENAQLEKGWQFKPRHFFEFLGATVGLMFPVYFAGVVGAWMGLWRRRPAQALPRYLFCMGAPVYLAHLAYTLHSRVHPNWIAVSVLPGFLLMMLYWDQRRQEGWREVNRWLTGGLVAGLVVAGLALWPEVVGKLTGWAMPAKAYPLRRIQGWGESAEVVEVQRRDLEEGGRKAFIICDHYGLTGQLSFYIPAARERVKTDPLVYYKTTERPENQFYFWPGYVGVRTGQNALFVTEYDTPGQPPAPVAKEFESVTYLGAFPIERRGMVLRTLHLWACKGLK